ncbi:hypothetical protein [Neorhizobium sp. NCHU2750]|uniref:hypothetical protein n=1 Tax=Neorhizobium sp. NCHU2750 TaxID=1825976 RepID=UPI000E70EE8C
MADLVSRKPKTESNDESTAVAIKTIALEYKPDVEEAHPATEAPDTVQSVEPPAAPAGDVAPEPPSDPEPVSEPPEATPAISEEVPKASNEVVVTAAAPAPVEPIHAPIKPVEVEGEPAPTRAKKIAPVTEPADFKNQADEAGRALAAGPKSILDEMAELDADVAELRRQLAKKLTEQNAQLRKMLARFDAR